MFRKLFRLGRQQPREPVQPQSTHRHPQQQRERWAHQLQALHTLHEAIQELRQEFQRLQQAQDNESRIKCVVCCDRDRSVLLPCRHFVLCHTCLAQLRRCGDHACPVCRKKFTVTRSVFW